MESGSWTPITTTDAVASGWAYRDDGCGTITRALDQWILTSREQQSFMSASLVLARDRWAALGDRLTGVTSEGRLDEPDSFLDHLNGLMPDEYEWLLLSGVLKDSVSAYEIYLTQAIDEVLNQHGCRRADSPRNPTTAQLEYLYGILGLRPYAAGVRHIVGLRNVLTHARGQLRSKKDRARYGAGTEIFSSDLAHLDESLVQRYMAALDAATRLMDPVLWLYAWKRSDRIPAHLLVSEDPEPCVEKTSDRTTTTA